MTAKQIAEAHAVAAAAGLDERSDYSGRCMYGAHARWAAEGDCHSGSPVGQKLRALGAVVDNMGLDYIYYDEVRR